MLKLLKWIGILFVVFMIIGATISIFESPEDKSCDEIVRLIEPDVDSVVTKDSLESLNNLENILNDMSNDQKNQKLECWVNTFGGGIKRDKWNGKTASELYNEQKERLAPQIEKAKQIAKAKAKKEAIQKSKRLALAKSKGFESYKAYKNSEDKRLLAIAKKEKASKHLFTNYQKKFEQGLIDFYNIFSEATNDIQREKLMMKNNQDLTKQMEKTNYQFKNICGKLSFTEAKGYKIWSITVRSDEHKSLFNNFGSVEYIDNFVDESSEVFKTISTLSQYNDDVVCIDGYFGESKYKKLTTYSYYEGREKLRHYSNDFAVHIESIKKK